MSCIWRHRRWLRNVRVEPLAEGHRSFYDTSILKTKSCVASYHFSVWGVSCLIPQGNPRATGPIEPLVAAVFRIYMHKYKNCRVELVAGNNCSTGKNCTTAGLERRTLVQQPDCSNHYIMDACRSRRTRTSWALFRRQSVEAPGELYCNICYVNNSM